MNSSNLQKNAKKASSLEKKQIQALKQQTESLSELLVKLSRFYEGITPDVDKEMSVLRSHLVGRPNYTLANISISKLTKLLMQHTDAIKVKSSQTINKMGSALKKLQRLDNLSNAVKNETVRFLTELDNHSVSIYSALPQFEKTIEIYQRALENTKSTDEAKSQKNADDMPFSEQTARLHKNITMELKELIEHFCQVDQKDQQLQDIRQRLLEGITPDELLECCLFLIRIIVRDVIKEAHLNERFVVGLHKSLHIINRQVEKNLDSAKQNQQHRAENLSLIKDHIQGIDSAVNESTSLERLKAQTSQYLEKLSANISVREELDKADEKALLTMLTALQTELTKLEEKASKYKKKLNKQSLAAKQDPLTKIPNRMAYNERVDLEVQRWQRNGAPLSVAIVDIDHFKRINDMYGHAAGDKTLAVIARHLQNNLRSTDFVARWGGEEFILLFPDTDASQVKQPLEVIRRDLAKIPFAFRGEKVTITTSIGASSFQNGDDIDSVFARADRNLYLAKNSGRNKVTLD